MTAETPTWLVHALTSPIFWSVVTAALVYLVQKRLDRREQIRLVRQEAYRNFLDCFLDAFRNSGESMSIDSAEWREFERSRQAILLVASDDVARAATRFLQPDMQLDDRNARLAKLILAMRRDCFEGTRLGIAEISEQLPTAGPTKEN